MLNLKKPGEYIDGKTTKTFFEMYDSFQSGKLRCNIVTCHEIGTRAELYLGNDNAPLNGEPIFDDNEFFALSYAVNSACEFHPDIDRLDFTDARVLNSRGVLATVRLKYGNITAAGKGYHSKRYVEAFLDAYLNAGKSILSKLSIGDAGCLYGFDDSTEKRI